MFNILEGDGLIENIYHMLWTKDSIFGTDPYVMIPQTILYKYQKPCYWYFTSKTDGKFKRKSNMKIFSVDHIKKVFTKSLSKSGIVAYYIYKKNYRKYDSETKSKQFNQIKENCNSFIVEYFNLEKFEDFINNKVTYDDGILQKFEDPKGEHNFMIKVIWSPKLCLFEKNTNLKKIFDNKFDIYERAVTYDGEEFQTRTEAIKGNHLPDRIEKIANNISNHISNITLGRIKITRMILNFKLTNKDQINFLWCSSLRIDNSTENKKQLISSRKDLDTNKMKLTVPDNINLFKYSYSGKSIRPLRDSFCYNCDSKVESYRLYEISYKILIESHENQKRDKDYFKILQNMNVTSSGVEILPYIENNKIEFKKEDEPKKFFQNLLVPKVISSIYPSITYKEYHTLKKDLIYNSKSAYVCDSCFLNLTRYCNFAGSNTENVLRRIQVYQSKIVNSFKLNDNSTENDFGESSKVRNAISSIYNYNKKAASSRSKSSNLSVNKTKNLNK